jgi:hypothetical protein
MGTVGLSDVKLLKTLVDVVDGPNGASLALDTVLWRNALWLVPKWQQAKNAGMRQPTRIVRPRLFQFEKTHSQQPEDYFLACSISKAVLDGRAVSEETKTFEVV